MVAAVEGLETESELQVAAWDHFAGEMDHMADCILSGGSPQTPGEEGLRDQLLMEAIYRSANDRVPIRV